MDTRRSTALLCGLLLAAGPTTRPATAPTATFDNDECGFKLKYPAGWIVPEHPDDGQVFTVWMPLRPGTATRPTGALAGHLSVGGVGLRVEQATRGVPDRQAVRELTDLIAANLFADEKLGAKHVALRPATVGDLPARQVRFIVQQPAGPVTVAYVIAVRNGTEYVFNAAAPSDQFDALWPSVEAMLASFDLRR
jgi:hypothetical protein